MKCFGIALLLAALCVTLTFAQSETSSISQTSPVPRMVNFSGLAIDNSGKPLTGVIGITFSIYKDQQDGVPLWLETQNVSPNSSGRYTVMLGATKSDGLPVELFTSGEAHWIGVQVQGQAEQPRVLLLSVPYALKASDADMLGGKPLSAFVLAQPQSTSGSGSTATNSTQAATGSNRKAASPNTETADYIAMFTNGSGTMGNSALFQNASGNIGLGYTNPTNARLVIAAPSGGGVLNSSNLADQDMFVTLTPPGASDKHAFFGPSTNTNLTLGVNNTEMMRITNTGNVGIGYSNPTNARLVIGAPKGGGVLNASNLIDQDMIINLTAPGASDKHAFFGPSTATNLTLGVGGTEMMRITSSGQIGIGTSTPSAMLEVNGPARFDDLVDFASGQSFSGVATLEANTFTGNQTVNGNVSATGVVTGAAFNIGSNLFAWGSWANQNVGVGYAGNTDMTGTDNTAMGYLALAGNQSGISNTAIGHWALNHNANGLNNTAIGDSALFSNSGNGNTASGVIAMYSNTVGSYNVAYGYQALSSNVGDTAGDGWHNTAVGANALFNNTDSSGTGYLAADNTAIGYTSLYKNTTGHDNTAGGYNAMFSNTTGYYNTADGDSALNANSTGADNTAAGFDALADNASGSTNTAFGAAALLTNQTGNNNTALGYDADVGSVSLSNATAIGAWAQVTQSNSLVLGCVSGVHLCPAGVSVGIGTTAPDNLLTVNGSADKPGGGSWGTYSDLRLKTLDGSFDSGLTQIMKLHPVRYRYTKTNALGIQDPQEHVGLVAQDVQKVIPEAVTQNSKGYLLLNNDPILWSMLNAIQEQQSLIQKQQQQIRTQQAQIARLSSRIKTIQGSLENGRAEGVYRAKAHVPMVRQ